MSTEQTGTTEAPVFYKTVVTVTVLSEEPFNEMELADVAYAIGEGDCSGQVEFAPSEKVDGPTMAKLLIAQGSDPEFFQIDADGNPLDED